MGIYHDATSDQPVGARSASMTSQEHHPPGIATQNEEELEFLLELEAWQQTLARRRERLRGVVPVEGAGNHLLMLVRD